MGHRLSFVSSPDSDYEVAADDTALELDVPTHRPTRASSDPSIAAVDSIPVRPVEPPPAPPRPEVQPHLGYDPRYVCTSRVATLLMSCDFWKLFLFNVLAQVVMVLMCRSILVQLLTFRASGVNYFLN